MDDKKRIMFVLEEDHYFITLKILAILTILKCDQKPLVDYRKLGIIFEAIKSDSNLNLISRSINDSNLSFEDNEHLSNMKLNIEINHHFIQRIMFFLEKQNIIRLFKNGKKSTIDVEFFLDERIEVLLDEEIFRDEFSKLNVIIKAVPRIRSMNYSTLVSKVFGNGDELSWVD